MLASPAHLPRMFYAIRGICLIISVIFILAAVMVSPAFSKQDREEKSGQMTAVELQSELMSFADRFATVLTQAFYDFEARGPKPQARYMVLSDIAYSTAAVFTIAAGPNPEVAMLDMVVLATIGRMIYEEHWSKELGDPVEDMVEGFRKVESDIWFIAQRVLTSEGQQELRHLIRQWRQENPRDVFFQYLRFSDFASERQQSTIVKAVKSRGWLKPVGEAKQEIEQTRMLAERAMFLASRMPLLTGYFGDLWLSQWILNPEVKKLMSDVQGLSKASERVATVAERLPKQIGDLGSQEDRLRTVLADLRQTMKEGSEFVSLVNTAAEGVGSLVAQIQIEPTDTETFGETVTKLKEAAQELNTLVGSAGELLSSLTWEHAVPMVARLDEEAVLQTKELIRYTFVFLVVLVLITMVAMLGYRYAATKLVGSQKNDRTS